MAFVLKRKLGERVVLTAGGEKIDVLVSDLTDGHVRLSFEAGSQVEIKKAETLQ